MKFLDLFAGIGGFRLGMESAGHECVGFCEIDKFARASYKAIHDTEGEIELHDITTVSNESVRGFGSVDIIGDCAVVIVGLALLIKEDVNQIFEESDGLRKKEITETLISINANISEFQLSQGFASKELCRHNLVRCIGYLKNLGYDFDECFELAYQEIKDRKGRWIDGSFVKWEDLPDELRAKIK